MTGTIEGDMQQAGIPLDAQRETLLTMEVPDARRYVESVAENPNEPRGINVMYSRTRVPDAVRSMTLQEARMMFMVLAKELVLAGRRCAVQNIVALADDLGDRDFGEMLDEYSDLVITGFYRGGMESPLTPRQTYLVTEYFMYRVENNLRMHTFSEIRITPKADMCNWYPEQWIDWFNEHQMALMITGGKG